ncbi:MAG: hypothetical protein U0Z53_29650 [Blastocatellia bacterium]
MTPNFRQSAGGRARRRPADSGHHARHHGRWRAAHLRLQRMAGQAKEIWRYGRSRQPALTALVYAFPSNSAPQTDCPRFTQRNDGIAGWAGQSYVNGIGWGLFLLRPERELRRSDHADGVTHKEFFSTTGGTRGLPSTMGWFGG